MHQSNFCITSYYNGITAMSICFGHITSPSSAATAAPRRRFAESAVVVVDRRRGNTFDFTARDRSTHIKGVADTFI